MEETNKSSFLKMLITIILTAVTTGILVLAGTAYYVIKTNPFNLKACVISNFLRASKEVKDSSVSASGNAADSGYDHPLLSTEQEAMLEDIGVDVSQLPNTIPPELEACLVEKVGQEKVAEVKAGAIPGTLDIIRAQACFNN